MAVAEREAPRVGAEGKLHPFLVRLKEVDRELESDRDTLFQGGRGYAFIGILVNLGILVVGM